MEKVLVIAPHNSQILGAVSDYANITSLNFVLLGSKKIMDEICYNYRLNLSKCEIIDIEGEVEIALYARGYIEKNKIKYLVFGMMPYVYYQKIMNVQSKQVESLSIVDTLIKDKFIFVSSGAKHATIDFDDKKTSIIHASKIMSELGIKYVNASLVYPNKINDNIETKIIKMIIKDLDIKNLNVTDYKTIKDVFHNDNVDINLIVMKNYELSRLFLDSLDLFTDSKVCSLLLYNQLVAVDCEDCDSYDNIFFALFIIDKLSTVKMATKAS